MQSFPPVQFFLVWCKLTSAICQLKPGVWRFEFEVPWGWHRVSHKQIALNEKHDKSKNSRNDSKFLLILRMCICKTKNDFSSKFSRFFLTIFFFLEYSILYLEKKSLFGRNQHRDPVIVIIDREHCKRLRLKPTVWRHC